MLKYPALAGGSGKKERYFYCKDCDKVYDSLELKNHKDHDIVKHPTQKPLKLTDNLIKSCNVENGTVLVPFRGSGTECVSAKNNNMNYIGFDINDIWIKIAEYRLNNI